MTKQLILPPKLYAARNRRAFYQHLIDNLTSVKVSAHAYFKNHCSLSNNAYYILSSRAPASPVYLIYYRQSFRRYIRYWRRRHFIRYHVAATVIMAKPIRRYHWRGGENREIAMIRSILKLSHFQTRASCMTLWRLFRLTRAILATINMPCQVFSSRGMTRSRQKIENQWPEQENHRVWAASIDTAK